MDDKIEKQEMNGQLFAFYIIGLAIVVMILGTVLENKNITNFLDITPASDNPEQSVNANSDVDFENVILASDLSLGDYVSNIDPVVVRQSPGGTPVGRQTAGLVGRIIEGPVDRFETKWWRVDYENSPDGWTEADLLTTKRGTYLALNVIPITLNFLKPISIIISVIFVILILIVGLKLINLRKLNNKKDEIKAERDIIKKGHQEKFIAENENKIEQSLPVPGLPVGEKPLTQKPSNRRWENIQSLSNSYNSNDWKQAIIESDIILDEMLRKMGYSGESIGERLKQVEQSDFTTLNQAWEAHKIRNRVAHSGSNFVMSKDEAERVVQRSI
jgi:hypothetical protein